MNLLLISFVLLTTQFAHAVDDKCLQLANNELARLGFVKGAQNNPVDCINKGPVTDAFNGPTTKWQIANIKDGPKAEYESNFKHLTVVLGRDEITLNTLTYEFYFSDDCSGINQIFYYGALGPGMSINLTKKKCDDLIKNINKPHDYDFGVNDRAYLICTAYKDKFFSQSTPSVGSSTNNNGSSQIAK